MISRLLCLWKKNLILFLNQAVIFFYGFKFFKNKKKISNYLTKNVYYEMLFLMFIFYISLNNLIIFVY